METAGFIDYLKSHPAYDGQIAHLEVIAKHSARYEHLADPLPERLVDLLADAGITRFYSHQARAIDSVHTGQNVIIATETASGKTACYNVPVLESHIADRTSRALYLFPTKALAQDQLRVLESMTKEHLPRFNAATFDGDTPQENRADIRRSAHVVLSNPDMLHLGIMPNHSSWAKFFAGLKYVIIDEAHAYRGVFGSHLANVIRRLRRICRRYGSSPQFILCSATIANAREHAEGLVGLPFEIVEEGGSPHGERDFVFWNPPLSDAAKMSRGSTNSEATFLFTELVSHGIRSIAFTGTRRLAELIYLYSHRKFADRGAMEADRISAYRAGYLPEERRRIEKEFFSGNLLGVTATNALELGIDIGDLGATVLTGYPGSIASTWQQAGRAGRGEERSLSFLIAQDNPLDQYLMRHPEAFFGKSVEHALIDPGNSHILAPHLLCAAYELPLGERDGELFGNKFTVVVAELEESGILRKRRGRWHLSPQVSYPAETVSIRSASSERYALVDSGKGGELLETLDADSVFFSVYPGAIYLHQGESYLVEELDLGSRTAYVRTVNVPYYTQTKEVSEVRILEVVEEKVVGSVKAYLGTVEVTTDVVGFKKKRQYTDEIIGEEPLSLPSLTIDTVALWFDIPADVQARFINQPLVLAGGLHALEHAAIGLLPLYALCDRNDIGGLSTPSHIDTGKPQVFIYDAHPGGIGISEKGFELLEDLWRATLSLITECPCEEGCPSCVYSPKCGNNNEPLDKQAAKVILEALLGIAGLP